VELVKDYSKEQQRNGREYTRATIHIQGIFLRDKPWS